MNDFYNRHITGMNKSKALYVFYQEMHFDLRKRLAHDVQLKLIAKLPEYIGT
jgi:hypothetical protein